MEIQSPEGSWIAAPVIPGTAIVNTGDLISRWTNGMFRSSPHRVVNPTGLTANKDRYSFVLFHSPNPDAVISCLERWQEPDNPPKFGPITAGEHLRARAAASWRHGYYYCSNRNSCIACNGLAESLFYGSLGMIFF